MNIGIFGTGIVAQTLGATIAERGATVVYGTRNVATTLARAAPDPMGNPPFAVWREQHPEAALGTFEEAAAHGELLINATAGTASLAALNQAGAPNLRGKILIDVANPLDFSEGFPPTLTLCNTDSLGEQIQRAFSKTKVVKTLNTMNCNVMVDPGLVPGDHDVFLCGDDADAKAQVAQLLNQWFGWRPEHIVDLGDISSARGTEMLIPLWARLLSVTQHPMFNFHIARAAAPSAGDVLREQRTAEPTAAPTPPSAR